MFGFFKKKSDTSKLEEDIKNSFNSVKEDFGKVGQWINHFDSTVKDKDKDIEALKQQLFMIRGELDDIKDFISLFGSKISKQPQTDVIKQTGANAAQTVIQTAVQSGFLERLTLMERAIVGTLVNSENKLSYEDISVLLGKDKSTIRGQINAIKQKSDGLIMESSESNGKKRVFIPDEMKQILFKTAKVRVKQDKKKKILE
jgi:predicted transcriptional regulator